MIKKIMAVLLVALLVMQTGVFAVFDYMDHFEDLFYRGGLDEAEGKVYYVAGSNNISKEIKLAIDLGLIDVYTPNNSVTRNDVKGAIELMFGSESIYQNYFKKGGDDTALTVDEAIVILMDAAGYSPYIKMSSNGELQAYINEAGRRGLLSSINYAEAKKNFTIEMFYNMFYDALTIPVVGASYSKDGTSYYISEETILEDALNFTLVEGVVTASPNICLKGHSVLHEGAVKIDLKQFEGVEVADLDSFVGYEVDAYVDKDGKLVSIAVDDSENVTKFFDDSVGVSNTTTLKSFEYYNDNDRLVELKLSPYMNVIYNNATVTGSIEIKDLDVKNGSIRFIDNNNDKVYDVAIINEYTSFYPSFIYLKENILVDRAGNEYDFTAMLEEGMYRGMRDEKGNAITLADLHVNTAVTLKTAYESNVVTELVKLEDRTYEGIYKSYNPKSETPYIIGDNAYQIADVYAQEANSKIKVDVTDKDLLPHKAGERILVYLDHNNKIIKSTQVEMVYRYGFITKIGDKSELFSSDVQVVMFSDMDKWERRFLSKKVWYNQARYVTPAQILNNEAPELYSNGAVRQLVKFKLNAKGEICELETADISNETYGAYNETERFQRNFGGEGGTTLKCYRGGLYNLGFKYRVNDGSTKVFIIPTDPTLTQFYRASSDDQDQFFYTENDYIVQIFDVDKNYVPDVIVKFVEPMPLGVGGAMSQGSFVIEKGNFFNDDVQDVTSYLAFTGYNWETSTRIDNDLYQITYKPYPAAGTYGKYSEAEKEIMKEYFGGRYVKVEKFEDIRRGDVLSNVGTMEDRATATQLSFALDHEMPLADQAFEIDRSGFSLKTATDGTVTGTTNLSPEKWTGYDLIAFGKVVNKDSDAIILNCDKNSNFTNVEYNRVITPGAGQAMIIYNVEDDTYDNKAKFPSIQIGDFVYVEVHERTLKNLIVYRP